MSERQTEPEKRKAILSRIKGDLQEQISWRRLSFPPELRDAYKLTQALSVIQERWPDTGPPPNDPEHPVFIFSAGWRCGSTLLQRLLISSGEVAIWGEPLGDAAFIARLGHSLSTITHNWPTNNFFTNESNITSLTDEWIANLTPEIPCLRAAHRAFIKEWLATPAEKQFGLKRWGLKEVRLTIDHARYLKWLFPNARFVFIYRNPVDAFQSWKGNRWRSTWPGYYRNSAMAYARHWRLLLEGYLQSHREVGGIIVKFEDLVSRRVDIDEIMRHIGVANLDTETLENKVGTPKERKIKKKQPVSLLNQTIISAICGKLMKQLGYSE